MPLFYGEGPRKAFLRLQEHIIARSDDETIFAWRPKLFPTRVEAVPPVSASRSDSGSVSDLDSPPETRLVSNSGSWSMDDEVFDMTDKMFSLHTKNEWPLGILAEHPEAFSHGGSLRRMNVSSHNKRTPYSFSNQGLEIAISSRLDPRRRYSVKLKLECLDEDSGKQMAIQLRRDKRGNQRLWYRVSVDLIQMSIAGDFGILSELGTGYTDICIVRSSMEQELRGVEALSDGTGSNIAIAILHHFVPFMYFAICFLLAFDAAHQAFIKSDWATNRFQPYWLTISWAYLTIAWMLSGQALWYPVVVFGFSMTRPSFELPASRYNTLWLWSQIGMMITVLLYEKARTFDQMFFTRNLRLIAWGTTLWTILCTAFLIYKLCSLVFKG